MLHFPRFAARLRRVLPLCLALAALALPARAQHDGERTYIPDPDPVVQQRLAEWQDVKLGLLMHWGAYSQWGIVESWSICSEDEPWCARKSDNYEEYKRAYENLATTFNPVDFEPERWAEAARRAGMKYVVFTTKHHDGFNMFDTKLSDYKITGSKSPFRDNPRADVTKAVFDAFRNQGFLIGAYFSKPDWHSPYYWWPYFATPDRHVNYDVEKYPERWQQFVQFTHGQIDELMSNYGRVDILWLDGGWVRPVTKEEKERRLARPDYNFTRIYNQDIDMPGLVAKARAKQPGLIVVDRAVAGPHQNYLTPEAQVPDTLLPYPWETCMPMATSWSHVPNDRYKTPRQLIHMLADVVAKGGNLLLNIGPDPRGRFDADAYDRLKKMGDWMSVNSEAIYGTRPILPYVEGKLRYTRGKDGAVYAIYLAEEGEERMPARLTLPSFVPAKGAKVTLLGAPGTLKVRREGSGISVEVPKLAQTAPPSSYAWVFRISKIEA